MKESNPASVAKSSTHGAGKASAHHAHKHGHHGKSFGNHVDHASHRASATPSDVTQAVQTAIAKEGVPKNWEAGLHYLIQRESEGKVGAANSTDSARGLFQLTKSSYHLNPHGAASFGNAVEEAQGGIRYIAQRYQTADNAVGFWKKHGWY